MKKGFTLIEMLVVIGIIAILSGASMVGYAKFVRQAEDSKSTELLSNVVTALTAMYQTDGSWPKRLITGARKSPPLLDEDAALPIGKRGYLTLDYDQETNSLKGYDRYGVMTSEGVAIMKRKGRNAQKNHVMGYIVNYAIDEDGDGKTEIPSLGITVRATACAWCAGKGGKILKSWTRGQEVR